ncbi:hypothetical protein CHUAL_012011 [Chamberlinius hualienensis]
MGSIVLKTLSVLLGLFFIFVGLLKLTPLLNPEIHKEMRKSFVQYTKVFPLPLETIGVKLTSKWFRRSVGAVELFSGLLLLVLPERLVNIKKVANFVLLITMLGAIYSHRALGERFERMAPALVFSFMLTCRLVVNWQIDRKEALASKPESKKTD